MVRQRLAPSAAVHGLLYAAHDQLEQRVHGASHVVARGRARLEVREAMLGGLGPRPLLGHGASFLQVRLVSAEHHIRVLAVRVRAQLLEPRTDAEKGLFASEVEEHEEAHGISKEGRGQAAELLLARRVPQLQVDALAAAAALGRTVRDSLLAEVDAHGGDELAIEGRVGILVEEASLAHAGVAQRQELDEVVVVGTTRLPMAHLHI